MQKKFYESVEVPEEVLRQYNHLFFLRNFLQKPDLCRSLAERVEQRLLEELPVLDNDEAPIESYEPHELTADSLKKMYTEDVRPIVLKGYAKDHDCVRKWTPELFKANYGDFKIFYTSSEKIVVDEGTRLGEFVDQVVAGRKDRAYIENMSDIFNAYPELHDHLGLERLADYFGDYASYHRIAQLFLGGLGTGAVYHCANELNCFLNVYGKKKWYFVHPKYSFAMYTSLINKGFFIGSFVKHKAPRRFIEEHFPLYNRIPKLSVTLEPGDMLLNPPWWWHAINNVTPVTIAVATRWGILTDYIRQAPVNEFVQSFFMREGINGFKKKLAPTDKVIPDRWIRRDYKDYGEMGWKAG